MSRNAPLEAPLPADDTDADLDADLDAWSLDELDDFADEHSLHALGAHDADD